MNITLISNLYEPYARGGAEVIVKRTASELLKQGHQVTLITSCPFDGLSSLFPKKEEQDGLTIYRYYPLNFFFYANDHEWPVMVRAFWHLFDVFNFSSALIMRKLLKQINPDLVITHNLMGMGYAIPWAIRSAQKKHVHVLHDIQLAVRSGLMKRGEEQAWFVSGWPARLYQWTVKKLFGSPSLVLSPSKYLLQFYEDRGYFTQSKREVLRNPIDKRFTAISADQAQRSDDKTHFAYIGQLAEHKGLNTLRLAFARLSNPQTHLHVVGDGPMKEEIQKWAQQDPNVTYHGRMANEQLPELFQSIDVTVLPTETYENSPTIVFESLASARPVIVSNIGGAAEIIVEGKNGYSFEPGSVDALVEKMQQIKNTHQAMRETARQSVDGMESSEYVKRLLNLI